MVGRYRPGRPSQTRSLPLKSSVALGEIRYRRPRLRLTHMLAKDLRVPTYYFKKT